MNARARTVVGLVALVVLVPAVVSAQVAGTSRRLAGPDRFTTAVEISRDSWAPAEATTAFLASGDTFPDALAMAASTKGRGPVLLVQRDVLPAIVAEEIRRLQVCEVVTAGGVQAIEQSVFDAAAALAVTACAPEAPPTEEPVPIPPLPPGPTPSPEPTASPAPDPGDVGTRENPYPLGTEVDLYDDWTLTVLGAGVQDVDEEPDPGNVHFAARVRVTYEGNASDSFNRLRLGLVGEGAVTYEPEFSCTLDDPLPSAEAFPGGTLEGEVCWQVPEGEVPSLVLFDDQFGSTDSPRPFFATN